jgi:cephalosporin-C deacetylase-like acetyl esterase
MKLKIDDLFLSPMEIDLPRGKSRFSPTRCHLPLCFSWLPRILLAVVFALASSDGQAAPDLTLKPKRPDAIYRPGESIIWRAECPPPSSGGVASASYVLKEGGGTILSRGVVHFEAGVGEIATSLDHPGTILAEITATNAAGEVTNALAGAAVAPEKIARSSPCPADFDAFWQAKLDELAKVPAQPVLTPEPSERAGVEYWKITMDNIRGTHIEGQLARPAAGGKLPGLLIVQWAGNYPLQKSWVTGRAAEGWLVLEISAHDLPIDQPQSYYDALAAGVLTNYPAIGKDDREKSYFLRMFLGDYRAVEYLSQRSDWDGRRLAVSGTSQGGLQCLVAAGLNPKITAVMALVPAGCDNTGDLLGRRPGWPDWMAHLNGHDPEIVRNTSRYFDGVNFAARVKCPVLAGLGLVDITSPPSGVFAALNQLSGPKEVIVLPDANHHGDNHTHASFEKRATAWRNALLHGQPVPPPNAPAGS